jgi:hypothetical protein
MHAALRAADTMSAEGTVAPPPAGSAAGAAAAAPEIGASVLEALDVLRSQRAPYYVCLPAAALARACTVLAVALKQHRDAVYPRARNDGMLQLVATAMRAHPADCNLAACACVAIIFLRKKDGDAPPPQNADSSLHVMNARG